MKKRERFGKCAIVFFSIIIAIEIWLTCNSSQLMSLLTGDDLETFLIECYILQADSYCDLGEYDKSIEKLNEAINRIDAAEIKQKRLDILAHHLVTKIKGYDAYGNLQLQMEYDAEQNMAVCQFFDENGDIAAYQKGLYFPAKLENGKTLNLLDVAENFGADGESLGKEIYFYEPVKNRFYCTEMMYYHATGELWYGITYHYDEAGRMISESEISGTDNTITRTTEYRYDDKGRRIGTYVVYGDGAAGEAEEYCREENGYIVMESRDESGNLLGERHCRYDVFEKETENIFYTSSGDFLEKEEKVYNAYGDVVLQLYTGFEEAAAFEERYEYEYSWYW